MKGKLEVVMNHFGVMVSNCQLINCLLRLLGFILSNISGTIFNSNGDKNNIRKKIYIEDNDINNNTSDTILRKI